MVLNVCGFPVNWPTKHRKLHTCQKRREDSQNNNNNKKKQKNTLKQV